MLNENDEAKSAANITNTKDEHVSDTSQNKQESTITPAEKKWAHFLNTYQKYYHAEFDWVKYIRDCKLYQKNFSIKEFLETYGKPAVESFTAYKNKILNEKKADKTSTSQTGRSTTDTTSKMSRIFTSFLDDTNDTIKLELKNNINEARYLMLIQFITPQTSLEKKAFKKWMKLCKKQGLTKRQAYSRYLLVDDDTMVNVNVPRHKLTGLVDRQKEIINYETKVKNEKQILGITTTTIDGYRSPKTDKLVTSQKNTTTQNTTTRNTTTRNTTTRNTSQEMLDEINKIEL